MDDRIGGFCEQMINTTTALWINGVMAVTALFIGLIIAMPKRITYSRDNTS